MKLIYANALLTAAAIFILWKRQNTGVLERISVYLFVSIIHHFFMDTVTSSFQNVIVLTKTIPMFIAGIIYRYYLIPILIVLFWSFFKGSQLIYRKIALLLLFTSTLAAIEYMCDWAGMFRHVNWNVWLSAAVWYLSLLLTIAFGQLFHFILRERIPPCR